MSLKLSNTVGNMVGKAERLIVTSIFSFSRSFQMSFSILRGCVVGVLQKLHCLHCLHFCHIFYRATWVLTHYHTIPHFDALKIYIAVENIVRKEKITCNKQFFFFSQCFLPYMILIFLFKYTLKCHLQFA